MKNVIMTIFLCAAHLASALAASGNGVVIADTSGTPQVNSPESITRFFKAGEIPHFAQATASGVPLLTQCDVKNRWPDGSVKFAIVSFVAPSINGQGVLITFVDQNTGNNTGYLAEADMLAPTFNFDATMRLSGSTHSTISARTMLAAGHFSYWLKGPIVTAVIIEDRANRSFDVNSDGLSGNPLHPIYEAWFYPQNHSVDVGFTLENTWASSHAGNSARHQTFALTLSTGSTPQINDLTQSTFTQFAFTRWRRDFWVGGTPNSAKVRFDFNTAYLESTGAYPNWDYKLDPNDVAAEVAAYQTLRTKYPERFTIAGYSHAVGGGIASYPQGINVAGEWHFDDWKGLFPSWDTLYFFSGDPSLRDETLTSADLAGRFPIWYREADHNAGSGQFFDAPNTGTQDPYGRPISVNARQQFTSSVANWQPGCKGETVDNVNTLTPLNYPAAYGGFLALNTSHIPAFAYMAYTLTGKYAYLEEIQLQAAGEVASVAGCFNLTAPDYRQGYLGFANSLSTRNTAWQFRDMSYAVYTAPDGDITGQYFKDKLLNNIALQEGGHGIPQDVFDTPDRTIAYEYGKNVWNQSEAANPSPMGVWYASTGYAQVSDCHNNLKSGYLKSAYSNFPEHFMMAALGTMRQLEIVDTKPLLTIFGRRYFHIILDPAVHDPYLLEEYVYPQQKADGQWVSDWTTYKDAYCVPKTSWEGGAPGTYATQALGSLSYMSDITVDGYSGLEAWKWLKANLPIKPDARWSQAPVLPVAPVTSISPP
jgi:hypothetical protein